MALLIAAAALLVTATPAHAVGNWASSNLRIAASRGVLPPALLHQVATAPVTRAQFVAALARLDAKAPRQRRGQLRRSAGIALPDAPVGSTGARAISLGWLTPQDGLFAGSAPITANEASRGIIGALGLRDSATKFALQLQRAAPSAPVAYYDVAAQVYARALGLRYNHLQGSEQLEVGPTEVMDVAHVGYMLAHAASIPQWKLRSLKAYERFSIPALGANGTVVVNTALSMVGQPYVWAGETEGPQPEGHGGFDCSGFVWRTVLGSGLPDGAHVAITGRSSMVMSGEFPASARVLDPAKLLPGDVIFFGDAGHASTPSGNFHAALWLGHGWFAHSSGSNDGVSITHLDGWWLDRFSWGRHTLLQP